MPLGFGFGEMAFENVEQKLHLALRCVSLTLYPKVEANNINALFLTRLAGICLPHVSMEKESTDSIIQSPEYTNKCRCMWTLLRHKALWLSVHSVMQKNIMFNQSDHEPPCCSNTESQHARMTGDVKWRVMTPVQRRGLVAMTLKHGKPHSAPVKCLKKDFPAPSLSVGGMTHPHTTRSPTCLFNILWRLLSMSHLSSVTSLHCEARHIICLLSSSIMYRIMA